MKTLKHALRRVLRRLPAPLKARLRELRRPGHRSLVSVVVPVYNVEKYVEECLRSVLAQSHRRLEVIVVDDGSPDGSMAIVEKIAAQDRRVRMVRQANGGLGAARNTGVRHARGAFICFVDSDDTLPGRAVEMMLTSLTRSGSDFAVGSLVRQTGTATQVPPWAKRVHEKTRTGRTIEDDFEILKDVFAWNKLFRREFFDRVVVGFPEGIYEDQVPSARAYLHGRFDVLEDVVYRWRVREDASSITQQKATFEDLSGRWGVIEELAEVMSHGSLSVQRTWQAKVVGFDMRAYYEQVPRTDDDYWEFLRERVCAFVDEVGYDVLQDVPIADRFLAAAVYHGERDDVAELLIRRESRSWKVPGVIEGGHPVVGPDFYEGLGLVPDDVLRDLATDVEVVARTTAVSFDGVTMSITGGAYLAFVDLSRASSSRIRVLAVAADGEPIELRVEGVDDPEADLRARDPWNEHRGSGFVARLDMHELDPARRYRFVVSVDVDGVVRETSLEVPEVRGGGRLPAFSVLDADGRWCVRRRKGTDDLVLRHISANRVPVVSVTPRKDYVEFALATSAGPGTQFVATTTGHRIIGQQLAAGGQVVVRFPLPRASQSGGRRRVWQFAIKTEGVSQRLAWTESAATVRREGVGGPLVGATEFGNVIVTDDRVVGEITEAALCAEGLRISGWADIPADRRNAVVTAELSGKAAGSAVELAGPDEHGRFEALLPIRDQAGIPLSKRFGFAVVLRVDGRAYWLRAARGLLESFPADLQNHEVAATLTATPSAGAVWVRLRSRFAAVERSRYSQQRLVEEYWSGSHEKDGAVLFEAFGGRVVGDSPLAISRELHEQGSPLAQYWSVECLSTAVPEWATPVLRYSRDWYSLLGSAQCLVNNNNWPWFFRKQPHQTYLQTWHGTPLKRIGNHVPDANLSLNYRALMVREAAAWDYLLAQNEYAQEIFPSAFGYVGPVLLEGYPRNDSLLGDDAEKTRRAVRARLAIPEDARVLLYAPTWRDNLRDVSGYGRVSYLDSEALAAHDGAVEGTSVVLYRGHANTATSTSKLPRSIIDVTSYPDVNDLMLASDALITDYSSIMFDYAVMRKPIYFLVPDLELYGTTTRGFYRALDELAPGPLCASTEELVDQLGRDYWADFGAAYEWFVAEFIPLDDGQAARRVVARTVGHSSEDRRVEMSQTEPGGRVRHDDLG